MAEIFSAIVIVGGIIFAVIQMRQTRQQRGELDSPFAFEWFQWRAMTLGDLQNDSDLPAYEAHTEWQPSNLSSEI